MNKKGFMEKDYQDEGLSKATVKGKSSTGIEFESNANLNCSDVLDVAVTLPVDPKCKVKVTQKSAKEADADSKNKKLKGKDATYETKAKSVVEATIDVASGERCCAVGV